MDGVAAGVQRSGDDHVAAEVGLRRGRPAERYSDVDGVDVERVAVGFGVDPDVSTCRGVRGAGDPAGDLATVRDQEADDRTRVAVIQCLQTP